jgi:type IX secretion system PorP/SprF family membrane protein
MNKLFTKVAILIAGVSSVAYAQQDPQFTQWMFNKLIYNAGYAGTSGGMCGTLQYRKQWASFDGAPNTVNFAGDARVLPNLGVGLTFMNDKIGPMSTNYIRLAGSYLIQNAGKIKGVPGTLGIGVDVGVLQKSINSTWVTPEPDKIDPTIPGAYGVYSNQSLNKTGLDLGAGVMYNVPGVFYLGVSSTHLPATTLQGTGKVEYDVTRHYYFMTGYTQQIAGWNYITANIKYKSDLAAGALDINVMYMNKFKSDGSSVWIGPTYRLGDAAAILLGTSIKSGASMMYKGGVSYDFVLSKLKGYTSGSFELFLGACYTPKPKSVTRYDNDRYY